MPGAVPVLLQLGCHSPDNALRAAALAALANYDDPAIAGEVLKTVRQPVRRRPGRRSEPAGDAPGLGGRVPRGGRRRTIDPRTVPREIVEKLALLDDPRSTELVTRHFGDGQASDSSAELQAQIDAAGRRRSVRPGVPKPGRQIFVDQCARCHVLFGKGGKVGPDLTTYRRDDLDTMLLNIVNPSAEIREGYAGDDRRHDRRPDPDGRRRRADKNVVVLRGSDGKELTLSRDAIEEMKPTKTSIMPEGLLKDLSEQQVRDLFAYLRSTQPNIDR